LFPLLDYPALFLCGRSVLCGASTFMSSFLTLLSRLERMGLGLLAMSSRFSSKSLAFAPSILHCPTREEHRKRNHDHGADDDQDDCECAHSVASRASSQVLADAVRPLLVLPLAGEPLPARWSREPTSLLHGPWALRWSGAGALLP